MSKELRITKFYFIVVMLMIGPILLTLCSDHIPTLKSRHPIFWLLYHAPFVLFALIAYLGLQLHQMRVCIAAAMFETTFIGITFVLGETFTGPTGGLILYTTTLVLPISIFTLFLSGEGKFLSLKTLSSTTLFIYLSAIILYGISNEWTIITHSLFYRVPLFSNFWHLPIIVIPVIIITLAILYLNRDWSIFFFSRALAFSIITYTFTLNRLVSVRSIQSSVVTTVGINFSAISALLLYALYRMYWEESCIDELTGLLNRHTLNNKLNKLGSNYSIAMIDIDFFKKFNDTYGHLQGDNALRFIASQLEELLGNKVFRFGGEEFCVLFDGKDGRRATRIIYHLCSKIAHKKFHIRSSEEIRKYTSEKNRGNTVKNPPHVVYLTISAGVAQRDLLTEKPEDVMDLADKALYSAKEAGRNRVVFYGDM